MWYAELIFLIAAAGGILWGAVRLQQHDDENDRCKRETLGHCYYCGYDLRASPGECPECGRERRKLKTTA